MAARPQAQASPGLVGFFADYWRCAHGVLYSPQEFFDNLEFTGAIGEPLAFFAVCALVYSIMSGLVVFLWMAIGGAVLHQGTAWKDMPLFFAIWVPGCLVLALLGAGVICAATHALLKLMGGKGNFASTLTVLALSWVTLLITWLPFIGWMGGFYFLFLASLGLKKAHGTSGFQSVLAIVVGAGVVSATCLIVGMSFGVAAILTGISAAAQDSLSASGYSAPAQGNLSASGDSAPVSTQKEAPLRLGLDYLKKVANPGKGRIHLAERLDLAVHLDDQGPVEGLLITAIASATETRQLPPIYAYQARQPWSLVVQPGPDDQNVVVEAYGDSLDKPLFTETIRLASSQELREENK